MDQFYKMNVFFFVTTIAVIVMALIVAVAAIYIIAILQDIKYISRKAKTESEHLAADLEELRTNVREEGAKLRHLGNFFANMYKKTKK